MEIRSGHFALTRLGGVAAKLGDAVGGPRGCRAYCLEVLAELKFFEKASLKRSMDCMTRFTFMVLMKDERVIVSDD